MNIFLGSMHISHNKVPFVRQKTLRYVASTFPSVTKYFYMEWKVVPFLSNSTLSLTMKSVIPRFGEIILCSAWSWLRFISYMTLRRFISTLQKRVNHSPISYDALSTYSVHSTHFGGGPVETCACGATCGHYGVTCSRLGSVGSVCMG
jgi:hypothetical protein